MRNLSGAVRCAGAKINAIENLGATQNQFDSIDLSDNAVIILEGFPKLPRLKTLLLSNNRITRIARKLDGVLRLQRPCSLCARCAEGFAFKTLMSCN